MRRIHGLSLLELLLVMAIIGVIGGIGFLNGNRIAQNERAHGSIATFQQSIWQGATAAASRGREIDLTYDGQNLVLVDVTSDETLRVFELPENISTNLPTGTALKFLPPGKVDQGTLSTLNDLEDGKGLRVQTGDTTYGLQISLIGEVRSEVL